MTGRDHIFSTGEVIHIPSDAEVKKKLGKILSEFEDDIRQMTIAEIVRKGGFPANVSVEATYYTVEIHAEILTARGLFEFNMGEHMPESEINLEEWIADSFGVPEKEVESFIENMNDIENLILDIDMETKFDSYIDIIGFEIIYALEIEFRDFKPNYNYDPNEYSGSYLIEYSLNRQNRDGKYTMTHHRISFEKWWEAYGWIVGMREMAMTSGHPKHIQFFIDDIREI